jgi:protease-4
MMARRGCIWGWIVGVVALLVIFVVTMIAIETVLGEHVTLPIPGARVGLVRIEGLLADSRPVIDDLKWIERAGVGALVIRVDSPGGGVAAAQEIYDYILRIKESGLPIVVSMGSVAASGGYYVSCPADSIIANPGTVTGSIGVIMSFANLEGLLDKVGVDIETLKSGEFKDTGSWSRPMTPAERKLLQGTIDDIYDQFVEAVVTERGLPEEHVRAIADGRVLSGRQALAEGLVDGLGSLEDAVATAGRMAGIQGRPRTIEPVKYRRLTVFDLLRGGISEILRPQAAGGGAQYLYNPSK